MLFSWSRSRPRLDESRSLRSLRSRSRSLRPLSSLRTLSRLRLRLRPMLFPLAVKQEMHVELTALPLLVLVRDFQLSRLPARDFRYQLCCSGTEAEHTRGLSKKFNIQNSKMLLVKNVKCARATTFWASLWLLRAWTLSLRACMTASETFIAQSLGQSRVTW